MARALCDAGGRPPQRWLGAQAGQVACPPSPDLDPAAAEGIAQPHADVIPVLGTVAAGEHHTAVGRTADVGCAAAKERLEAGTKLCSDVADLARAPLACARKAPAWKLLACVANQCLSYDSAILSPELCAPLGRALDEATATTAQAILGDDLGPDALAQLRVGRELGGRGLRSAEAGAHVAFTASCMRLATHCLQGPHSAPCVEDCAASAAWLAGRGAHLDEHGICSPAPPPKPMRFRELCAALPKRQRGIWDALDRASAASLPAAAQRRLEDCGGPEGGAYLLASKVDLKASLTDAEFVAYSRLRLGLDLVRAGPCQNTRVTSEGEHKQCGVMLDPQGAHCIACKVGGAVVAAHSEGCQILADATREAGYYCRREQVVPELATAACPSPTLDCDAFGLAGADRLLIDFTLRSGMAGRYKWGQRAHAAASGEGDKQVTYPAAGGVSVRGAGMEVLGRHGPDLTALLSELADRARARAAQQGKAPCRWLRRWRCQLSAVAARLVGRQATLSQACAALPWETLPPPVQRTGASGRPR